MQKVKVIAVILLMITMISGCGTRDAAIEKSSQDDVQNETESINDGASEQEIERENPAENVSLEETVEDSEEIEIPAGDEQMNSDDSKPAMGDEESEAQKDETVINSDEEASPEETKSSESVDIKDYLEVWTADFGGDLEQQLADKLGSEVEVSEMGDSYVICDGALEFYGAANNTGFFVWEYAPVENFYMYGISVGMEEDEAAAILKEQGLEEKTVDSTTMYSTDFDRFRIELSAENGKITKLTYVRSTAAKVAADFTETP